MISENGRGCPPQAAPPAPNTSNPAIVRRGTDNSADWTPARGLRQRRGASRRLPALVCGHRDTLDCTAATVPVVVEPGTRHAVLALARRYRFDRWEVEQLVGDLTATELITFGGAR